jgi:histidinol dehydrogenase
MEKKKHTIEAKYEDGKVIYVKKQEETKDNVVNSVLEAYKKRSNEGIRKYGTTLDRNDLSALEWLQHIQEELMDATLYIEKLKTQEVGITAENVAKAYFDSRLEHLAYADQKKCIITGIELTDEDTYNRNSGCPYANFVEGFRARHKIPVRDLRKFVDELKSKL